MKIAYIDYSPKTKSLDIFVSGCNPPYCENCCNPELIDFNNGKWVRKFYESIDNYLDNYPELIENIFLLGGSFNHQNNNDTDLESFLYYLKDIYRDKNIWLFAREGLNDIQPIFKEYCDYIKCGEYIPKLTCDDNIQYGIKLATSNQKIYKKGVDY